MIADRNHAFMTYHDEMVYAANFFYDDDALTPFASMSGSLESALAWAAAEGWREVSRAEIPPLSLMHRRKSYRVELERG